MRGVPAGSKWESWLSMWAYFQSSGRKSPVFQYSRSASAIRKALARAREARSAEPFHLIGVRSPVGLM